jgi:large subunit ribosomal protein L31
MKKDIHPNYGKTTVTCSCGKAFEVNSTTKDIQVEICSACHPYFTGKEKLIDTAGRVDKFKARIAAAEKFKAEKTTKNKDN